MNTVLELNWEASVAEAREQTHPCVDDMIRIAVAEELTHCRNRIKLMELEACEGRRCMAQDEKELTRLRASNAELLAACQELSKLYHYRVKWSKFREGIERAERAAKNAQEATP